jgi:hypothetical protein
MLMLRCIRSLLLPSLSLVASVSALAATDPFADLESRLASFHANPVRAMNETPRKADLAGQAVSPARDARFPLSADSADALALKEEVRARLAARAVAPATENIHFEAPKPDANATPNPLAGPIGANDRVEVLFPSLSIQRNLEQMEAQGLLTGRAEHAPWSDAYWPLDRGMIGTRYSDPEFVKANNWAMARGYIQTNTANQIVASGDPARLAQLSPAEKYDLIVGDRSWTLTEGVWARGQQYNDKYGKVDYWMGICEGWALASIMVPQPTKTLQVPAAGGGSVTMYPSDIRGLASLLWATGRFPVRLIGTRCSIKDPPKDSVGRVTSPECFDTNPATWHLAAVNEIGVRKGAFIFDSTYDFEVWNQPVYAYKYTYFNPQTLKRTTVLHDAAVSMHDFNRDKFRSYRSPNARYVVGIGMEVTYVMETVPTTLQGGRTAGRTVQYIYDLELDDRMNVIGGEWYTNLHPDFLWASIEGTKAQSTLDRTLQPAFWDGVSPVPSLWTGVARQASAAVQPLAGVVDRLVELSHQPQP